MNWLKSLLAKFASKPEEAPMPEAEDPTVVVSSPIKALNTDTLKALLAAAGYPVSADDWASLIAVATKPV